jgi:DNA-binding FrmR family transcriptional regulator
MSNSEDCLKHKIDISKRLKRIEGQVRGVLKMVEEDKSCSDILTQVAAIRSAVNKAGAAILEKHSKNCMIDSSTSEEKDKKIRELMETVQRFLNFVD